MQQVLIVRDDDGAELGELAESGRLVVYRDSNGDVSLDIPSRLSGEEAEQAYHLLGVILGKGAPAPSPAVS